MRGLVVPGAAELLAQGRRDAVRPRRCSSAASSPTRAGRPTVTSRARSRTRSGEEAVVEALTLSGATAEDALLLAAGPADKIAEDARPAAAAPRQEAEPDRRVASGRSRGSWTSRSSSGTTTEAALLLGESPVHGAARGRPRPARDRAGRGAVAGLRSRAERHGDRRRQHPYPRSGSCRRRSSACSA